MKKVISPKNMPTRPPAIFTVVMWLLLDRIEAPGWVQGTVWTLVALIWIGFIIAFVSEQYVDVFGSRK